jgi:hypothetical protein
VTRFLRSLPWKVIALAFVAMCANDVAGTVMVIFEAQYNAVLAGLFDVLGWLAGLICAALAIDEIIQNGWRTRKSLSIIVAVSAANFVGTIAGVALAVSITHH